LDFLTTLPSLQQGYRNLTSAAGWIRVERMTTAKQPSAARRNIKKAATAAKRKRTLTHLPKRTRTALGKEGTKAAERNHDARGNRRWPPAMTALPRDP
jgi:hypothetical protein